MKLVKKTINIPEQLDAMVSQKLAGESRNFSTLVRDMLARYVGKKSLGKVANGRPRTTTTKGE